ncbi:hypothetical protein AXG93_4413s1230 [Marchantia polymorpha subsp. ruderalis]|uniref:Uncharacterized protein n=1 Tax=Marchantia polymorpha subsp. ruderalis TaxID=1480154 RepID=A0A176W1N5_MARPO|nr:hypothetical protein AXG93_4413s1230 [Marchantia polymorpha subsp. ruderalis]
MVREWLRERHLPLREIRPHPERWQVSHWEQVLGRCAGEEGHLLFEAESVKVSKEEEISFSNLFKNGKHSKNGSDPLGSASVEGNATTCAGGERGIDQSSLPFLIIYYRSMGCLTTTEGVQFPLLSRSNPGRYMREVEVDTDSDKASVSPPHARPTTEDEPRRERAPRKRKWDAGPEQSQRKVPAAPVQSRPTHEPSSRPKQKARKLVQPTSSAETGRAAEMRDVLPSQEEVVARILGKSVDFSAPKARTPSEEARRPSGKQRQHAGSDNMLDEGESLASEAVALEDSPSAEDAFGRLRRKRLRRRHLQRGSNWRNRQRKKAGRRRHVVPAAQPPLAIDAFGDGRSVRSGRVGSRVSHRLGHLGRKSSGAAVAAEEAAWPSAGESPRTSVVTEILKTEEETSSEGQEVESVQGTPTGVLCEQVVPLLRYLDRKAAKYADPRHPGSFVELMRNRTRTKVATNPELYSLDAKYRELAKKNDALHQTLKLSQKMHKTLLQMRDDKAATVRKEFEKMEAELNSKRIQNRILTEELVRQTRTLEQCQLARQAYEELLRRMQSQCDELRAQRAEVELQILEIEGNRWRATDRTREELAARVSRCLRGYTHWEVAAQETITLRDLEIRAAALISGDSRSRRRVAKRLDAFPARSREAVAHLEREVTAVLHRLGLRSRAEDWSGRELERSQTSRRRHSR